LENILLAFKMSGNCHFQIKWLDNPEYKKRLDVGNSESKVKGSFGQKEFYFSNMVETALESNEEEPRPEEH
jgi:hypothetical protein